jgi:glutamate-1-semialdehyde 2,1-aminomutase
MPSSSALAPILDQVKAKYAAKHPASAELYSSACAYMPGGNTRSNLHVDPFPLTLVSGEGAYSQDADGNHYIDFIGNYSAGLYGHNNPKLQSAMKEILDRGLSLCGPTTYEAPLATVLCQRFPSLKRVRFCHSGTEANLLAIATAKRFTGRNTIMVFRKAYHGGVLAFANDPPPGMDAFVVPHRFVLADYDDSDGAKELFESHKDDLAAVLVEPVMGSSGCYPASVGFLYTLMRETQRTGAVLIFDEVMTSRLSPGGMQGITGIIPDMTTMGKYLGGGMPLGAFGGRGDIMAMFDPRSQECTSHPGTFNINPLSLRAGYVGLTEIYTHEVAHAHNAAGDALRMKLNDTAKGTSMWFSGVGSL